MEKHVKVPGMQEHPEIHITPKYPELLRRMTKQSNGEFDVNKISHYIKFAMRLQLSCEAEDCFTMLLQYARADESKNTGLKILEHCCSLHVTHYNNETCANKALRLLIESRLLSLFINKSDYHGELILNWIFQMPIHSQNRFWYMFQESSLLMVLQLPNFFTLVNGNIYWTCCQRYKHICMQVVTVRIYISRNLWHVFFGTWGNLTKQ